MQKPPSGMAIAESLYGSKEERITDSKIFDPTEISMRESLRSFLMKDFEADRPMPDDPYEREKSILHRYPLSADEIQSERKEAAGRCGI